MGSREPAIFEVLGVGDAFSFTRYGTSFLLSTDSGRLLIDGPPGLFHLLHARGIPVDQINSVICTHVHADHASGIESLLLFRRYRLGLKTRLYTSERVMESMRTAFFASFRDSFSADLKQVESGLLEDYIEFVPLSESSSTPIFDKVRVDIRHNWHPVPTLGLKLTVHDTVIGVSGDHCYRPLLLRELLTEGRLSPTEFERMAGGWLWESDVIYHEASRHNGGGHTLEEDLLSLPEGIRSKLRLVHTQDDFVPGSIPLAAEGERVLVYPEDNFELSPVNP